MKIEISSRANPRLKELLAARDELFFFAGEKLVRDILARRLAVDKLLVRADAEKDLPEIAAAAGEFWLVTPQVMEKVSGMKSPPSLLAVIGLPAAQIDFRHRPVTVGLVDVQDPGNIGTVFRCASAFGVSALALAGNCARPNHPKVVRSAQTALLDVSFQEFPGADELVARALAQDARVYVTGSHPGKASLPLAALERPCLVLFGNEGRGLPPELLERFPLVRLEQEDRIDSLNVAVSACILMHELRRPPGR
jgi:RNA methyltransferase, TrmH family